MDIEVKPLRVQDLDAELTRYEHEFGMPSAVFADAYARGDAPAIREETAIEWVMAYEAWALVSGADRPQLDR